MSGLVSQAWVDAAVARALSDAAEQHDKDRAAIQRVRAACADADDYETAIGFAERVLLALDGEEEK